jgi:hypothetical protein
MRPRDVAQETGQPTAWQAKRRMFARRNCHAVDRNPVGADCFFERENAARAQQTNDCKLCREYQQACLKNHTPDACNNEFNICLKYCRKK